MNTFGIVGLLFTLIIALGARKVWLVVVHVLSKMFKNEASIKKAAFCVIFATVMLMAAPFIMPFSPALRMAVWALYLLYAGLGLYQIYDWLPIGKSKDSE
jgi:hypothetical protein